MQPFAVGVTVIEEVTGVAPLLADVNGPIFPFPLVPNPTSPDAVHEKPVPIIDPLKPIPEIELPLQ